MQCMHLRGLTLKVDNNFAELIFIPHNIMTKSWWQFHVWYYANEGSDQYHTTHIGIMSVCTEF